MHNHKSLCEIDVDLLARCGDNPLNNRLAVIIGLLADNDNISGLLFPVKCVAQKKQRIAVHQSLSHGSAGNNHHPEAQHKNYNNNSEKIDQITNIQQNILLCRVILLSNLLFIFPQL